jgi:hypothetical protein
MIRWSAVLVGACLLGGCIATEERARVKTSPRRIPATSPQAPADQRFVPSPNRDIPDRPGLLAAELHHISNAIDRSIRRWRSAGGGNRPPRILVLQALYHQRITRRLARDPRLAQQVFKRVRGDVATDLRANLEAMRGLRSLARPVEDLSTLRAGPAEPPFTLRRHYRAAEERFRVRWQVLAAVNFVESAFGKLRSNSYAGAQGPMQFLPSTWDAYGMGGNVRDPRDAIMGAANYLSASGAPGDYRAALFAYNPSEEYVDAVLGYAHRMMDEPDDFLVYYSWQVYVLTRKGPIRLTGPGL